MKNLIFLICLSLITGHPSFAEDSIPVQFKAPLHTFYLSIEISNGEISTDSIISVLRGQQLYQRALLNNHPWMDSWYQIELEQLSPAISLFIVEDTQNEKVMAPQTVLISNEKWEKLEKILGYEVTMDDLDANGVLLSEDKVYFNFPNYVPHRIPNMAPKLLPVRLIFPLE